MTKLKTVIKTLASTASTKQKNIKKDTRILLFTSPANGYNEETNTVRLGHTDSTIFLREIEDKYNVFFPSHDSDVMTSVSAAVKAIKNKLDIAKKNEKISKAAIQDFRFMRHGVEVVSINQAENFSFFGNEVNLDGSFWNRFDEWYSENRKNIMKKYKPVKVKKPKKNKTPDIAKAA